MKTFPIVRIVIAIALITAAYAVTSYQADDNAEFGGFEEVRIGIFSLPSRLDVASFADINVYKLLVPVHMSLLTVNYRSDLFSGAARSWSLSADKLTYTFHLNSDLSFGKKSFSCRDVEASFQRGHSKTPLGFQLIAKVGCKDEATFFIRLKSQSSSFLNSLAHLDTSIMPEGNTRSEETLTGLGPYVIESRSHTEAILRRKSFHPKLSEKSPRRLRFVLLKDMEEAFDRFERNEIDLVELEGYVRPHLQENVVTGRHVGRVWFLGFGDGFRASLEQRKCLYSGFSRAKMVESLAPSIQFQEAYGVVSPYMYGRSPKLEKPKQSAQRCLSDEVELMAMSTVPQSMVSNTKNQLESLGLRVKVVVDEKPVVVDRILSRNYQLVLASFGTDLIPEQTLHYFYSRESVVPLTKFPDDQVEWELAKINSSLSEIEREKAVADFEKSRAKDPYLIPLLFQKRAYLLNDCITSDNATTIGVMVYELLRKKSGCAQ